ARGPHLPPRDPRPPPQRRSKSESRTSRCSDTTMPSAMNRNTTIALVLSALPLLVLAGATCAQLPAPFQLPKAAAPAEPAAVTAAPDATAKLAAVRDVLARLDRPENAAEGSPP